MHLKILIDLWFPGICPELFLEHNKIFRRSCSRTSWRPWHQFQKCIQAIVSFGTVTWSMQLKAVVKVLRTAASSIFQRRLSAGKMQFTWPDKNTLLKMERRSRNWIFHWNQLIPKTLIWKFSLFIVHLQIFHWIIAKLHWKIELIL